MRAHLLYNHLRYLEPNLTHSFVSRHCFLLNCDCQYTERPSLKLCIVRISPRGEICQCRQCRRQCKIFASGVNFSIFTHFLCFFLLKLLKLGEIDGVKFLAWKSDGVKFLTNSMSAWVIAKITKDYLLILIHSSYHDQDSTGHEYCWSILDGYRNENKSQVRDVPLCQICSFFLTFWHKIGIEFT